MKVPCQAEQCEYDGIVNTDKQGYSLGTYGGRDIYMHSLCSIKEMKVPLYLTEMEIKQLKFHLRSEYDDVLYRDLPKFVVSILGRK